MPPIRLTDSELDAIMTACRPLEPARRDDFLRQVAASLQACHEIGDGVVYRVVAEVQRQHFDAPDLTHDGMSKYR
jgi:hypothetical protein